MQLRLRTSSGLSEERAPATLTAEVVRLRVALGGERGPGIDPHPADRVNGNRMFAGHVTTQTDPAGRATEGLFG
jgi:hypothetical protein